MGRFMMRRTLYAIVTLFILSLTIFAVVRLTGDPVTLLAEPGARAEDLDRVRAEWGLDRSWPVQYLAFAKNVFTGELGKSFNYQMPVSTLYFQRLPNSLELALAATLISFFIGIPAGILSAVRINSWWDSFGKIVALLGLSIPGFWLGLVLILVFSVWLRWLRKERANWFGRYPSFCAARSIRFLVTAGMYRASGALFSTIDTVVEENPLSFATSRMVTMTGLTTNAKTRSCCARKRLVFAPEQPLEFRANAGGHYSRE